MKPSRKIRTLLWNEFIHERSLAETARIYPEGIHRLLAGKLGVEPDLEVQCATLEEPDHGLGEHRLAAIDVVVWWGHRGHDRVEERIAARVEERVRRGLLGLVVLHSGHFSKVFKRLMGTPCTLQYRESNEMEKVWTVDPEHPIARGITSPIELPQSEMYGEPFGVPPPDELVFISWHQRGEVFRSGCCWRRGNGRIFYFSPGHHTNPIYHDAQIQRVIANGVRWAAASGS